MEAVRRRQTNSAQCSELHPVLVSPHQAHHSDMANCEQQLALAARLLATKHLVSTPRQGQQAAQESVAQLGSMKSLHSYAPVLHLEHLQTLQLAFILPQEPQAHQVLALKKHKNSKFCTALHLQQEHHRSQPQNFERRSIQHLLLVVLPQETTQTAYIQRLAQQAETEHQQKARRRKEQFIDLLTAQVSAAR